MTTFTTTSYLQSIPLYRFLLQYKVEKGEPFTHTSLGKPSGSYNIPNEQKDKLFELLDQALEQGVSVHLTEKPEPHTIIKADLDFKFEMDQKKRKYNLDTIKQIVKLYHDAIKYYLDVPDDNIKAFIFERDQPYIDRGNCKDGIHIMYPYIVCHVDIQHKIREHVLSHCQSILAPLGCKNNIEDIVDKSVISNNNWLMYGCSKPVAKPYKLSHVYDHQFNDLNIDKFDRLSLIRLLSIRDHDPNKSIPIRDNLKRLLEIKPINKHKLATIPSIPIRNKLPFQNDYDLDEIRKLVKILDVSRADNYKTWIEVGLCLHNISYTLLDAWIDFSSKSPKFRQEECEQRWSNFTDRDNGLHIGSLYYWAKLDNPQEYSQIIGQKLYNDIIKSQSRTTQDVACVVYRMYQYQYVCASYRYGNWYEFRNHRWTELDSAVSLRKKLGTEVVKEYLKIINLLNQKAADEDENNKDQYIKTAKNLYEVVTSLLDVNFKEKIIKECQVLFYNESFLNKLDANPDLIGFENGVYDLRTGEFRDGHPEDYISLSTGNDYQTFDETDENIVGIYEFLSQIFPNEELRDYVLILLSSFLEGRNPNEKFHIWTGSGGNGKSKLLELFEYAFGQYTAKIPVTLLTQKTRASSSAANPEVARLKGIRFVSAQEPEEGEKLNVGIMKEWTGGDRITCRALYKNPFDFKPQFKMVFCCNRKPALPPGDEGTWRRISVLAFLARFCANPDPNKPNEFKQDPYLTDKLVKWKEAFMYILLEHYKVYKENGLKEPTIVRKTTLEYRDDNDVFKDFINDCIVPDESGCLKLFNTYTAFKEWWKQTQSGKAPSQKDLKYYFERKFGPYYTKTGWVGYAFKKMDEENQDNNDDNDR